MLPFSSIALLLVLLVSSAICEENRNKNFQRVVLETHNKYRSIHGVHSLKWDSKLAEHAQGWANRCYYRHSIDRRPYNNNVGENISYGFPSMKVVIENWYEHEINNYDFYYGESRNGEDVLHLTQMLWKDTVRVGCAESYCENLRGYFSVCNYYPAGNYDGKYVKNVFLPVYDDDDEDEDDENT